MSVAYSLSRTRKSCGPRWLPARSAPTSDFHPRMGNRDDSKRPQQQLFEAQRGQFHVGTGMTSRYPLACRLPVCHSDRVACAGDAEWLVAEVYELSKEVLHGLGGGSCSRESCQANSFAYRP